MLRAFNEYNYAGGSVLACRIVKVLICLWRRYQGDYCPGLEKLQLALGQNSQWHGLEQVADFQTRDNKLLDIFATNRPVV